jgi:2-octaprenylphenol hydroxylase
MSGSDYDVVIVGAGPVGASLAALLGRDGLRIALLDRTVPGAAPSPQFGRGSDAARLAISLRVSAISRATWRLLDICGAAPDARRLTSYERMEVWDGTGNKAARIAFDCAEVAQPCLGYIIDNLALQQAFLDVVRRLRNVSLIAPTGLAGLQSPAPPDVHSPLAVHLDDGRVLSARLVIGADGAQSRTRDLAGIGTREHDYCQAGVVAHMQCERDPRATARQRFLPDGPLALLPLPGRRVSIVWSTTPEHARELCAADEAVFASAVTEASEGVLGALRTDSERASFPLRALHARQYTQRRLALVGDAAHVVHPLAGQGVNLGFLDAATLASVLRDALACGEDLGDHYVLRRYERWRKGENLATLAALDGLKRLFGARHPLFQGVRQFGLAAVDRMGPLKRTLARRAMGLDGDLPPLLQPGVERHAG